MSAALAGILAQRRAVVGSPEGPLLTLDAGANLVVDANSHFASWVYPAIDAVADFGALMTSTGTEHHNVAITGQTWTDMRAAPADRDGYRSASKRNYLVCGDSCNESWQWATANPTATAEQVRDRLITQARRYIAEARVAGWEQVILYLSIPTEGRSDGVRPQQQTGMELSDQWWRDHWRAEGLAEIADPRTEYPAAFGFSGTVRSGYMLSADTCLEADPTGSLYAASGPWIHPAGTARALLADSGAAALKRAAGLT